MAQNLKINGKQYNGVSVIGAPNANGGTSRFFDTSNATAEADDIAIGKTAYTINGKVTGTNQGGGSTLGTKTITVNGEYDAQDDGYDGYSSVDVQVPGSSPTLQAKTNIAPTTSSQTITADQGYDGLSSVQINAMPTGTAGTPTATKGAVSNHSISVTPSVTNSAGYISSGTINGTAVTVSASELDSGAKSITSNGNSQDVVGYASVNVNVPNTYAAGDEGKVVSSGALVSQTAHADVTPTTSDQTIDTTTNNSLKVKGDADLVAGNIKKDVEIFGVTGSYEGGGGGRLPAGYTEYDYILQTAVNSSVSGNINRVIVPSITLKAQYSYEFKFLCTNTSTTTMNLLGTRNGASGSKDIGIFFTPSTGKVGYWFAGTDTTTTITGITKGEVHTVKILPVGSSLTYPNNAVLDIDGTEYSTGSTVASQDFKSWLGFFRYAISSTSCITTNNTIGGFQIGEFIIKNGNTIVADFVPCDNGTHYGFYDLIAESFYYDDTVSVYSYVGGQWL